ncbi:MAG: DJ-1/PfpI family protein [Bacteroidota bacterium]
MNAEKQILVITGDAGESFEILYALHRLKEAGYQTVIAAPSVKSMHLVMHDFAPGWDTYVERQGYLVDADVSFDDVNAGDYVAVLIPGGRAPEYLRNDPRVISIVKEFYARGKYVFAICHGVQILVTAGLVSNKKIACYEHVKFEVESVGGLYVPDQQAVKDGHIITGKTWQSHPEFYTLVMACLDQPVEAF